MFEQYETASVCTAKNQSNLCFHAQESKMKSNNIKSDLTHLVLPQVSNFWPLNFLSRLRIFVLSKLKEVGDTRINSKELYFSSACSP